MGNLTREVCGFPVVSRSSQPPRSCRVMTDYVIFRHRSGKGGRQWKEARRDT